MQPHLIALFYVMLALINADPTKIDKLRQTVTKEEQRSFIKISVLLDTAPRVVATQLETAAPGSHLSQSTVYRWYSDFRDGKRTDVTDLTHPGQLPTVNTEENKERVRQLILDSEGMRTEDLMYETGMSQSTLSRLLADIGARKIRSRWVPHELTDRQMKARHNIAGKHLARYQKESGFLNKIIAIDETWLKSYDPQDARHTSEWLLPGQKP